MNLWVPPTTLVVDPISIEYSQRMSLAQKTNYLIHGGTPPPKVDAFGRVLTNAQHVLARVFFGHPSVLVEYVE